MRAWSFALCILALSASTAMARDCYVPTPAETARYQAIAGRLSGSGDTAPAGAVTQQEVQWALALETQVKSGYAPTAHELASYEDIARRLQASQAGQRASPPATPPPRREPAARSTPASAEDMAWAVALQAAVRDGARASEADLARYDDIYRRSLLSPSAAPEANSAGPAGPPVSAEELAWAQALLTRVGNGESLPDADIARYRDIYERYQAPSPSPSPPSNDAPPVSQADLDWALALERRVLQSCSVP